MEFEYGTYGYIAKGDLIRAEKALKSEEAGMCGFYCQQCLEKIGKQYIQLGMDREQSTTVMKSHKLKIIYVKIDLGSISRSMEALLAMTDCYFDSRYPGNDYFELSYPDAERYLAITKQIFDKVCSLIESMHRPLAGTVTREFGKKL